tara:strand:+ start:282 stop:827 length:546 start_codon:yes stop_codon:yes gene_type:complete
MLFLSRIFGRKKQLRQAAENWLSSIIGQSRLPVFYSERGVPDTLDGRFELMTLHAVLVLRRLRDLEPDGAKLSERLFDRLFSNFDYALRESGVGDLMVGKRMRLLGEAYLGRARAYDEALQKSPEALEAAIHRNLLDERDGTISTQLTEYVLHLVQELDKTPDTSLMEADINWPDATKFLS